MYVYVFFLLGALLISGCSTTIPEKKPVASEAQPAPGYVVKSYNAGPRPSDPVCADLNGDGYNDIAVALKKQSLAIMFNDKKGGFLNPIRFDTQPHNISLAAADIDNDGDIDLIPLTETQIGPIFLNDGRGNFTRHDIRINALPFSWHISAADLNNDGLPDLVVTSIKQPKVMIVMNKGGLKFESHSIDLPPDPGDRDRKGDAGAMKPQGEGISPEKVDLSTGDRPDRSPSSIKPVKPRTGKNKEGSEGFSSVKPQTMEIPDKGQSIAKESPQASGEDPKKREEEIRRRRRATGLGNLSNGFKDFVLSDINGDGHIDILLPSYIMNTLYVGINDGRGNFDFTRVPVEKTTDYDYALSSIAMLRHPHGKLPDVAVANEGDGRIFVFENNGGKLSLKETLKTGKHPLIRITSEDINGDGLPDLIAAFGAPLPLDNRGIVQVWLNSKNGFILKDDLKSEGYSAYVTTCKTSDNAPLAIVVSNLHEETLTIFEQKP